MCECDKSTVGVVCWSISELKALQLANIKTESTIEPVLYCTKDFCIIESYQSYCPQCGGHKNTVGAKGNSVADIKAQAAAKPNNRMPESQEASEYSTKVLCSKCQKVLVPKGLDKCGSCVNKRSNRIIAIVIASFLLFFLFKLISAEYANNTNPCGKGSDPIACLGTALGLGNNNNSNNSPYITSADEKLLGQSVSNEINNDWWARLVAGGIDITSCSYATLKSFVDCIYGPLQGSDVSNGPITAAATQNSAQPGGSLYITLTNLFFDGTWAQAALDEYVADAAADESAGKTYQDYKG